MDLAVDVGLADPAGDELGVLGTEIDDQDAVVVLGHGLVRSSEVSCMAGGARLRRQRR
jgi:hypothetical protein